MKLLIYSHAFAPQIGGVETYAMHLARGLAERSEDQKVSVTLATQSAKNEFDDAALPFAVVRRPKIGQLRKLIRESDVVHLAGPVVAPLMLALLARKPVVVEHHGYQASCPNGLLLYQPTKSACPNHYMRGDYSVCLKCNASESGWFGSAKLLMLTRLRRSLCGRATVNLCITNHVAGRIDLPHSEIVYYGIPDSVSPTESIGVSETATPLHLSVGYLGRLVEEKGIPTLIEAMHILREEKDSVALTIIGDGPQRRQLESMAAERNGFRPTITFLGPLQGEKLSAALSGLDVLVMPSLNEEPAGLVVMEQMMLGRGVIVSDHGGGPELAGDADLKFPPGDSQALAECIQKLLREPGLVDSLGRRARNRALEMFTLDRMIDQHYEIFKKLCAWNAR